MEAIMAATAEPWYRHAWRRSVLDMHITADDPAFLSQFDPKQYVDALVRSRVQSAVIYVHSHTGYCYFPTRVGAMHPNLHGRDIVREVFDLAAQRDIGRAAYYSLIFDLWAYRTHPDWRIRNSDGSGFADDSRYGVCCPNSPYREHVRAIAEELCCNYDFEGIRFDMTFWPTVCYCRYCRARYAREYGGEIPVVVNWEDPAWAGFQRLREAWLVEFAAIATETVRKSKPAASIEHQASTYTGPWQMGVTAALAGQTTFLQGDFYGDALQGSFARKMFYNLTPNRPGAFETSIGASLPNYLAIKSAGLLTCKAYAALADASAFVFIDSIDPVGTLNPLVYERMRGVFDKMSVYEKYVGGELAQDVGVFLSTESKYDFADNGKRVDDPHLSGRMPHVEAAVSCAKTLLDSHIPYGVVTKRNLDVLQQHRVLVLPNVLMMDEEEAAAIRAYVASGGAVYASRYTSLIGKDGRRRSDFLLADVFGVSYRGETRESFTYIAPAAGHESFFGDYTRAHPLGLPAAQMKLEAAAGASILGELVLPYTDPADPHRFVSIHNNPPGRWTGLPALVLNRYGKGMAIYAAGDLESGDTCRAVFANLIRTLGREFSFEVDAPKAVEVTLFRQPDQGRDIISLVNFQKELPNIPVEGVRVRVRIGDAAVRRLTLLPEERDWPFEVHNSMVEFTAPRLETFHMLALEYA
jgi:hypothetical protein